jgi:hypothetical protein
LVLKPGTYKTHWVIPSLQDVHGRPSLDPAFVSGVVSYDRLAAFRFPKKRPKFTSSHPQFGRVLIYNVSSFVNMVDTGILIALDESQGTGHGYDTIFTALTPEDDLSKAVGKKGSYGFGASEVCTTAFDSVCTIPFKRLYSKSENTNPLNMGLFVETLPKPGERMGTYAYFFGMWVGEVDTNGEKQRFSLQLRDTGGSFAYNSGVPTSSLGASTQVMLLDQEGYRTIAESLNVDYVTEYKGTLYQLRPSPSGDCLTIGKYSGPLFPLSIGPCEVGGNGEGKSAHVWGEHGSFDIDPSTVPTLVPPGKYRWSVYLTPTDGREGYLNYQCDDSIEVNSDENSVLSLKGDLRLVIQPDSKQLMLLRGQKSQFDVELLLAHGSATKSASFPRVTLTQPGRPSISLECSYYEDHSWGKPQSDVLKETYSVVVPKNVPPGDYIATFEVDAAPFGGTLKTTKSVVVK